MTTYKESNLIRRGLNSTAAIKLRFLASAVCLVLVALSPALGQTEYSDAWVYDPSDYSYDSATDTGYGGEGTTPPLYLIGAGVSRTMLTTATHI